MKKVLKSISICFIIATMLTAGAFAAAPSDPIQPQASEYIFKTTTAIGALGGGTIEVDFDIAATGKMKDVGALQVDIFEVGITNPVETYYYTHSDSNSKGLMAHDTRSHLGSVIYDGVSGRKYYANVTFYAGEHGVAGDLHIMGTAIITA